MIHSMQLELLSVQSEERSVYSDFPESNAVSYCASRDLNKKIIENWILRSPLFDSEPAEGDFGFAA